MTDLRARIAAQEQALAVHHRVLGAHLSRVTQRVRNVLASPGALVAAVALGFITDRAMGGRHRDPVAAPIDTQRAAPAPATRLDSALMLVPLVVELSKLWRERKKTPRAGKPGASP